MPPIGGTCDPAFTEVRETFAANFDDGELGAAVSVALDGLVVVDLWGGWRNEARTEPWTHDTLVNAYSVGKAVVALSVLQLVGTGDIELDRPASAWWPELRAGQQGATVRDVLSHRAGVPAIRQRLTNDALWDWDAMVGAVAGTEPWWPPGSAHGYHVNTYGHLVGELARRVTGLLPAEWSRTHLAGPLDADLDWALGPAGQARCAEVVWQSKLEPGTGWPDPGSLPDEQAMIVLSYVNPPGFSSIGVVNTPAWRAAQVPSTNIHATARGLARVYAALAAGGTIDGVTVCDPAVLAEAARPQSEGWCPFLERDTSFGLGFQPTRPDRAFGPNPDSFGHFGTGGSVGFADPTAGVAFGYVMNAVKPRWQNTRNRALIDSVYACL